jgi:hypothetical protein
MSAGGGEGVRHSVDREAECADTRKRPGAGGEGTGGDSGGAGENGSPLRIVPVVGVSIAAGGGLIGPHLTGPAPGIPRRPNRSADGLAELCCGSPIREEATPKPKQERDKKQKQKKGTLLRR